MEFGDKIRKLRLQEGLSQKALAEKSGVCLRTIRGYETQHRRPKQKSLYETLASLLHCEPNFLTKE